MKRNTASLHLAIGVFLFLGLACIAYMTLTLANTTFFSRDRYDISAKFTAANGLRPGSNVEISGVQVGKVVSVSLDPTLYQAVVTMRIENSVVIPVDSSAAIKTSGLIGDKFISIIPGGDENTVKDNGVILDTQAALDIEDLVSKYVFGSVE